MDPVRSFTVSPYRGQALFHLNDEPFCLREASIVHVLNIRQDDAVAREVIARARIMDLNTIEIGVDWSYLRTPDAYEELYQDIDYALALAREAGCYVSLRVRAEYEPAWYPCPRFKDRLGQENREEYITFHQPDFIEKAGSFMATVARHYHHHPQLLYLLIGFGCEACCRYSSEEFGNYDWVDYSEPGKADYRRFLIREYGTIEALNRTWGTGYNAFVAVDPPADNPSDLITREALDFKRFRIDTLRTIARALLKTVRAAAPDTLIGTFIEGGDSQPQPSNPRASNAPNWVEAVDFSKIPSNYFWPADRVTSHRHTTSSFLKTKVLINELTTAEHNQPQGATHALLETLQQPSYPSFIFLNKFNTDTLHKIPPAVKLFKDHYLRMWGREAFVGVLTNNYGSLLANRAIGDTILQEHFRLTQNLPLVGACFDIVYPESLATVLQAETYRVLIVSPLHMLSSDHLQLLRDYRGTTKLILGMPPFEPSGPGADPDMVYLLDRNTWRIEESNRTSVEQQLGITATDPHPQAVLKTLEETGKVLLSESFAHPSFFMALARQYDIPTFQAAGVESTWVHRDFLVGRAFADHPDDIMLPPERYAGAELFKVDGATLAVHTETLTPQPGADGQPVVTLAGPLKQHDLFLLFTPHLNSKQMPLNRERS